jgi:hypothetical protein
MEDPQFQLIAEQLGRLRDNIESRFQQIESNASHEKELNEQRFQMIRSDAELKSKTLDDHEQRLRLVTDSVTGLRTAGSLAQAAQAGLSLILAALAAWLGSRW